MDFNSINYFNSTIQKFNYDNDKKRKREDENLLDCKVRKINDEISWQDLPLFFKTKVASYLQDKDLLSYELTCRSHIEVIRPFRPYWSCIEWGIGAETQQAEKINYYLNRILFRYSTTEKGKLVNCDDLLQSYACKDEGLAVEHADKKEQAENFALDEFLSYLHVSVNQLSTYPLDYLKWDKKIMSKVKQEWLGEKILNFFSFPLNAQEEQNFLFKKITSIISSKCGYLNQEQFLQHKQQIAYIIKISFKIFAECPTKMDYSLILCLLAANGFTHFLSSFLDKAMFAAKQSIEGGKEEEENKLFNSFLKSNALEYYFFSLLNTYVKQGGQKNYAYAGLLIRMLLSSNTEIENTFNWQNWDLIADIQISIGENTEALISLRKAIQALKRETAEQATDLNNRNLNKQILFSLISKLANFHLLLGNEQESEKLYKEELDLFDATIRRFELEGVEDKNIYLSLGHRDNVPVKFLMEAILLKIEVMNKKLHDKYPQASFEQMIQDKAFINEIIDEWVVCERWHKRAQAKTNKLFNLSLNVKEYNQAKAFQLLLFYINTLAKEKMLLVEKLATYPPQQIPVELIQEKDRIDTSMKKMRINLEEYNPTTPLPSVFKNYSKPSKDTYALFTHYTHLFRPN